MSDQPDLGEVTLLLKEHIREDNERWGEVRWMLRFLVGAMVSALAWFTMNNLNGTQSQLNDLRAHQVQVAPR